MSKLRILRREGSNEPVSWDTIRYPHMLVSAPTNSGKSYFIKYFLSILCLHSCNASCLILDYKQGSDYWQWRDYDNVFLGDFVYDGFQKAYSIFENRRTNPESQYPPSFWYLKNIRAQWKVFPKKPIKRSSYKR